MVYRYLQAPKQSDFINKSTLLEGQIGNKVEFYNNGELDLSSYTMAIVGVKESRRSLSNKESASSPDLIRAELYKLYDYHPSVRIIDLGDIEVNDELEDTYFKLAEVLLPLLELGIFTVILGGSHDLTFPQYLGYQGLYKNVSLVVIDEKIDMKKAQLGDVDSESYLMPIFIHQPNYLNHFVHLGFQTYFCDSRELTTMENLHFEAIRLGIAKKDLSEIEPVLRTADLISIDCSSIRYADAPGQSTPSPNGFSGEEFCQLMKYAGYSEKLSSIGLFELNPKFDDLGVSAKLFAQGIWYLMEGLENRKNEMPNAADRNFVKYNVDLEDAGHTLIFWKSRRTDRWWMEIPDPSESTANKTSFLPCSYSDYQKACEQELPDRWKKAYTKII